MSDLHTMATRLKEMLAALEKQAKENELRYMRARDDRMMFYSFGQQALIDEIRKEVL